jgi:hypothetical protein
MPESRAKVIFDAIPTKSGDEWQLRANLPGAVIEYIRGFKTEAEAKAWPSSPAGNAWKRAKGYR